MNYNQRSFSPLNLDVNDTNLFDMVKGVTPNIRWLESGGKNYNRYNYMLSKQDKTTSNNGSSEQQFMDLFYTTTEALVTEKYKF